MLDEGLLQGVEVGGEEEGAVVHDAVTAYGCGIARDFFPLKQDVAARARFGRNSHLLQGFADSLPVAVKLNGMSVFDKGYIQVSRVVVDGSSAGDASIESDGVSLEVGGVYFR